MSVRPRQQLRSALRGLPGGSGVASVQPSIGSLATVRYPQWIPCQPLPVLTAGVVVAVAELSGTITSLRRMNHGVKGPL